LSALLVVFELACGANGDQVLGNIRPDNGVIDNDASTPMDAPTGCNTFKSSPAQEVGSVLSIFFTIDRSQSMLDPLGDKWDAFTSGFTRFLHSSAADGVGIGAAYLPFGGNPEACSHCLPRDCACLAACGCPCDPRMDPRTCQRASMCDPTSYGPVVDIAPMPQNGGPLAISLGQFPFGPTVVRPALVGALDYTVDRAARNHDERVVEVLIVGGPPSASDCSPDTIADCADAAASSSTPTNVVAFDYVGPSLATIATRGGGRLYEFDSRRDDIAMRFADLVQDLRSEPSCQFDVPSDTTDWDKVNLQITSSSDGGASTTLISRQVQNREACAGGDGWYYDRPDHPTRIIACDAACAKIDGPPEATVTITVGCGSAPPP
jgi:hypothetical protein